MAGALNWDSLSVAGAFLLGAILATVATIRVFRYSIMFLKREREEKG